MGTRKELVNTCERALRNNKKAYKEKLIPKWLYKEINKECNELLKYK